MCVYINCCINSISHLQTPFIIKILSLFLFHRDLTNFHFNEWSCLHCILNVLFTTRLHFVCYNEWQKLQSALRSCAMRSSTRTDTEAIGWSQQLLWPNHKRRHCAANHGHIYIALGLFAELGSLSWSFEWIKYRQHFNFQINLTSWK